MRAEAVRDPKTISLTPTCGPGPQATIESILAVIIMDPGAYDLIYK
jgi:hypothetical protein